MIDLTAMDPTELWYFAASKDAAVDDLVALGDSPDCGYTGWQLGRNPRLPVEHLVRFSRSSNVWLRIGVALNPNTPTAVRVEMVVASRERVQESVQAHTHGDMDTEALDVVRKRETQLRAGIASQLTAADADLELLADLAQDDLDVQSEVASNRSAPDWLLDQILAEALDYQAHNSHMYEAENGRHYERPAWRAYEDIIESIGIQRYRRGQQDGIDIPRN